MFSVFVLRSQWLDPTQLFHSVQRVLRQVVPATYRVVNVILQGISLPAQLRRTYNVQDHFHYVIVQRFVVGNVFDEYLHNITKG